jgi:hypothetical protein
MSVQQNNNNNNKTKEKKMKTNETYAIAILRQAYQPDLQGIETVQFDRDDFDKINEFDTVEKAQERVDELDNAAYCIQNGESGRPEHLIVDKNTMDYIQSGRDGDGSNYDWDWDCDHLDKDGNHCGECHNCISSMRYADRFYIREYAIKA